MDKCNCYHEIYNRTECWGTKERDECSCGGDEVKCDFYPEKRAAGQAKKTIELDDGKYTIVYDKNNQYPEKCLRYGEEWRNLTGDNLIFWLCARIEELEEEINDMNENFDYYYDNFGNMTV